MAGLSRGYDEIYCTPDYAVCLLVIGTACNFIMLIPKMLIADNGNSDQCRLVSSNNHIFANL